ncbi:MAG TPA: 3-keto-5-aminohexanoate cleavage protein [Candidatus Dormibacteraeota bacterium]|nr:3-keto-5-aminohexanoate cleavage protein [Candidatus Dormibacteraeota bacterium]
MQACLNGSRRRGEHPHVPLTPEELAVDARAVMEAGAAAIHVHPRDQHLHESLDALDIAAVVRAVREACPGLPVGVSTGAWIAPDPAGRLQLISGWTELPDFASVNLGEAGALQVIDALIDRNVYVEAGLWSEEDARLFIDNGLDAACLRVLVEVEAEPEPAAAVHLAAAIDAVLDDGLSEAPRLHHGAGVATWRVLEEALDNGYDVRIGLEDTLVTASGDAAAGNRELVERLVALAAAAGRAVERT